MTTYIKDEYLGMGCDDKNQFMDATNIERIIHGKV